MSWFPLLFLAATAIALLTGRAYFRRTVERATQPGLYWSTVAGYVAIALAGLGLAGAPAALPLAFLSDFMTDAATRLARDLRDGADRVGPSRASVTVVHRMKASPEGCAHGYRVQLSAASVIVVWCKSEDGQKTVGSHSTTSHLPAVDVPQTWIVDKAAGEPLTIELARTGGKPAVTRVN